VEVHISRLRAKLGQAAIVRSLRGLGYRLEEAKSA
jgi:DNA-binding response OmpR family regulator